MALPLRPAAVLALWAALSGRVRCQDQPARSALPELFALLDRFDPLDTAALPLVRVVRAPGGPALPPEYGFRLPATDPVAVRLLDLERIPLPAGARLEPADLAQLATQCAQALGQRLADAPPHTAQPGDLMPPFAYGLLIARACARRGADQQVAALAAVLPTVEEVRAELAEGLFDWLQVSFADPGLTRGDLLARHRVWAEAFQDHYRLGRVEAAIAHLDALLEQDRVRPAGPPTTPAELVERLRDQFAPVRREAGWVFLGPEPVPDSPAARLTVLGLAAVPALLDALADERPGRCVVFRPAGGIDDPAGPGLRVLSVGELAADLLAAVSGLRFRQAGPERWRAWWAVAGAQGELAGLRAVLRCGDAVAEAAAAARLLQRWPQHLVDVLAALQAARQRETRAAMLEAVRAVTDPRVEPFLREELTGAPFVGEQLAAARALLARGRRDGVERFARAWRAAGPVGDAGGSPITPNLRLVHDDELREVAAFLLTAGDPTAVRAVEADLAARPPQVRRVVLEALQGQPLATVLARAEAAQEPAVSAALAELLVGLLDDSSRGRRRAADPAAPVSAPLRTCDLAGQILAAWWPERGTFDPNVATRRRDLALATLRAARTGARSSRPIATPVAVPAGDGLDVRVALGHAATPDLTAALATLRAQPLTAPGAIQLLLAAAAGLPGGLGRVQLEVDRIGDGTPQVLVLDCGPLRGKGGGGRLEFAVRCADRLLANGRRNGVRGSYDEAPDFADLQQAIAAALAAPAGTAYQVFVELCWD